MRIFIDIVNKPKGLVGLYHRPKERCFTLDQDKFDQEKTLIGQEALAYICAQFSNITHNNYSPVQLFERFGNRF